VAVLLRDTRSLGRRSNVRHDTVTGGRQAQLPEIRVVPGRLNVLEHGRLRMHRVGRVRRNGLGRVRRAVMVSIARSILPIGGGSGWHGQTPIVRYICGPVLGRIVMVPSHPESITVHDR